MPDLDVDVAIHVWNLRTEEISRRTDLKPAGFGKNPKRGKREDHAKRGILEFQGC